MKKKLLTFCLFFITLSLFACEKSENGAPVDGNEGDVRVMQYNIRYGVGMDGNFDIDRLIKVMEDAKADVIILNEVDKNYSNRSNNMHMAEYIAEKLEMNFVFEPSIIIKDPPNPNREVGNAVLTKQDLKHIETLFFSEGDQWPRVITKCEINYDDGRKLYVAVSHYGLTESGRIKQAQETLDFLSDVDDYPVIFSGDLNAYPDSEPIRIISSKYHDAFRTRNDFYTFPANNPNRRIDYIFGNDKVTFRNNARVILTQASDHLPIMVDITF